MRRIGRTGVTAAAAALMTMAIAVPAAAGATPETRIIGAPSLIPLPLPISVTTQALGFFSFDADVADATFECDMDGRGWFACTSGWMAYEGPGAHTFQVRAIAPGGAVDPTPASHTWITLGLKEGRPGQCTLPVIPGVGCI